MSNVGSTVGRAVADQLARSTDGPAGVCVVDEHGPMASAGDTRSFAWASITKLLTAVTLLQAVDAGVFDLDEPAGPPGSTVRHLLAHASGLSRDSDRVVAAPEAHRVYSNRGIEVAAAHLERRAGCPFPLLLQELVLDPLEMNDTRLPGSPAHGAHGPVMDLARFARELLAPRHLAPDLLAEATTPAFPGLAGQLPGFGRQRPNDWGLGFETKSGKNPHWTSPGNGHSTFGHFGQSGCFLWVDPDAAVALVYAGVNPFGPWAVDAWPRLSTLVLTEIGAGTFAAPGSRQ